MAWAPRTSGVAGAGLTALLFAASVVSLEQVGATHRGPRLEGAAALLALLALATQVSLLHGAAVLRRVCAGLVVALLVGFLVWQIACPEPASSMWHPRQIPFLIAGGAVTLVGLLARRPFGRWLALGGGWAGVIGFTWILAVFILPRVEGNPFYTFAFWRTVLHLVGSWLLVIALSGRDMALHFAPRGRSVWRAGGARVAFLGAGVVLCLAAVPYLIMIGVAASGALDVSTGDRVISLGSAALLSAGSVLVIRQRTVGVLLLCLGAAVAAVLPVLLSARVVDWSGTFMPAVLGALLAVLALAWPRPGHRPRAGRVSRANR